MFSLSSNRLTTANHAKCVKNHYKNSDSVAFTLRDIIVHLSRLWSPFPETASVTNVLWGKYVRDGVYTHNPQNIDALKMNTRQVIAVLGRVVPDKCRKVIENPLVRIESCKRTRGGHLRDACIPFIMAKCEQHIEIKC